MPGQNEEIKQATKEAIKEWMDDRFIEFGKFTIRAAAVAAIGALAYFILTANGWQKKGEIMKKIFDGLIVALILFPVLALAQVLPTDIAADVDYVKLIGELIANPKALTFAFIGALIILVAVQALKSKHLGQFFKFLDPKLQFAIVTVLGQVYALVIHSFVVKDQSVSVALVGLVSSGGAAAMFNAIKLLFVKKAA